MIKLYIANLGKYNEGELVGEWVELPVSEDELNEVYVRIKLGYFNEDGEYIHGLQEGYSFYEEMAIHDYDCDIEGLKIEEYDSIKELNELAERIESMLEDKLIVLQAILENECNISYSDALDRVDNGEYTIYWNCYDMKDVAEIYFDDMVDKTNIPSIFIDHFDFESLGRELEMTGTFINIDDHYIQLHD